MVGTVTYFEPGTGLVLENGDKSIWIKTDTFSPMRAGRPGRGDRISGGKQWLLDAVWQCDSG